MRLASATSSSSMTTITISGLALALQNPAGLVVNPSTGAVIVSDTNNDRIVSLNMTTATTATATVLVTGVKRPYGLTFSPSGNLVIAADDDKRVYMLRSSGNTLITLAGGGTGGNMGYNSNGDGGPANSSKLDQGVKDVAYAADGALIITSGSSVRRVDAITGLISTLVGPTPTTQGNMFGPTAPDGTQGTRAWLYNAWGLAVNATGTVYFVERDAPMIRRLSCTP